MRLDSIDVGALRLLQEDARLSFRELATKLGTTTPTVSARIRALEDLGVIRGYRADIDLQLLGGPLHLVTVHARPAAIDRVVKALETFPGAEEVVLLAGGAAQARIRLRPQGTLRDLHDAIAKLEDVSSYDVSEVLGIPHRLPVFPVPEAVDVPCHQCKGPIQGEPARSRFDGRSHVFCCRQCLEAFRERHEKLSSRAGKHAR